MPEIVVVGSGVIGLTTAVRLVESGFPTRVVTRALPPATTSSKAAAIWLPFHAKPPEKVRRWARVAYHHYGLLRAQGASAGVRFVEMRLFGRDEPPELFWLADEYPFRRLDESELPEGQAYGVAVVVPFIHSAEFLRYILDRFLVAGGQLTEADVADLSEVAPDAPVVVNCSGLAAGELVGDERVHPIRGQVVRVRADRPLRHVADDSDPARPYYVVPRGDDCILGATIEPHITDLTPRPEAADTILAACRQLEPALADCEVIETYVGLRPGRDEVRLDAESLRGRTVIHNYGHGGSGFTLSWGCAEDVLQLVRAALASRP